MSFASDALLKATVAKVDQIEKMVLALKARLDYSPAPTDSRTLRVPEQKAKATTLQSQEAQKWVQPTTR